MGIHTLQIAQTKYNTRIMAERFVTMVQTVNNDKLL